MPGRIYALLVGIDDYEPPIPTLLGCRNDVEAAAQLLADRVPAADLEVRTLLDAEATRARVVETFRDHLGRARAGDVALFWFSGHGSQELAPPEFWLVEPDHHDETLVCHDSRTEGVYDLADKELGQLIGEVAAHGGHVVVVLDCCHSGNGTRAVDAGGLTERRAPTDRRVRPLSTLLIDHTPAAAPSEDAPPSGWVFLDAGRHVLLAACHSDQTAKEVLVGDRQRGVLSVALERAVREAAPTAPYRDLMTAVNSAVRAAVAEQTPQPEYTHAEDMDRAFLGGAVQPRGSWSTLVHERDEGWVLDAGAVHGIQPPADGETTVLAVFPADTDEAGLRRPERAATAARVTAVEPGRSRIEPADPAALDRDRTYRAVVTALPHARLSVSLGGDASPVADLRRALDASLLAAEAAEGTGPAEIHVEATEGSYVCTRPGSGRRIVTDLAVVGGGAATVLARLEHIARWQRIRQLHNPTSALGAGAVRMEILPPDGGEPLPAPGGEVTLSYTRDGDRWTAPGFVVRLTNTTDRTLSCALLGLNESYAVTSSLIVGGIERLEPGQSVLSSGGKAVRARVPDALWRAGVDRYTDTLQLVAATAAFDPSRLDQGELDVPLRDGKRGKASALPPNSLERLLTRVQTRTLSLDDPHEAIADWVTTDLAIVTRRPLDGVALGDGEARLPSSEVVIEGHPALSAVARLTSEAATSRDADTPLLPALLRDDPAVSVPFGLSTGRSGSAEASVLELRDVHNWLEVTPTAPLRLRLLVPLGPDEHVLPVAFDGEFYLPLGSVEERLADGVRIRIDMLPDPVSTRGLAASIKVAFRKLVLRPLGIHDPHPILALTRPGPDGTVEYDVAAAGAAVDTADRVLLHIHGIIGDTRGMVASSFADNVANSYGAVLAFDYENLHTRVDETAQRLQERLTAVGLGSGHGKTLDVVAHSMGGLVARWMIEHLDGAEIVSHLVTLGTPNNGSPWPRIQDWAFTALTFGLNGLATTFWPAAALAGLLRLGERIDNAFDDMAPDSERLRQLFGAVDPHVPYSVLVGKRALAVQAEADGLVARLLARIGRARLIDKVVALAFLSKPNDLAVAVTSGEHLPAGRNPAPDIRQIGCDHISYFSDPIGRDALTAALAARRNP